MRALITIALLALATATQALELAMPAGAQKVFEESTPLGSYALPVGPYHSGELPVVTVEGRIERQVWRLGGQNATTLQILSPLRRQLELADFIIRLDCASRTCGGFDFRFSTEVLPGPAMYVDLTNYRFLAAHNAENAAVSILVSRSSTAVFIQVIRVGAATQVPVETSAAIVRPAPIPTSGPFVETLETAGRVVLVDLAFESGAATLGEGDFGSLQAIADYLADRPDRRIAIVGHTDSVGSLEGNIALSRRRAMSVLERLVQKHGVARDQLEAGGMGYLAPLTSNLSAEGRDANRRVEAVLISTE